jgi:hypothetical protein
VRKQKQATWTKNALSVEVRRRASASVLLRERKTTVLCLRTFLTTHLAQNVIDERAKNPVEMSSGEPPIETT